MQRSHTVGAGGEAQAEHRHVEARVVRFVAAAPSARSSSIDTPHSAAKWPKYCAINSAQKRSMPAGTGVWVVNTPPARTTSIASVT